MAILVNPGAGAFYDLAVFAQYGTVFEVTPGDAFVTVGLPDSSLYPQGTEIVLINATTTTLFNVVAAGGSPQTSVVTAGGTPVAAPITVNQDTGLRLIARVPGWTVTGTF